MTGNLVRTTTYFDEDLLNLAKTTAVNARTPFYKVLNQKLSEGFKLAGNEAKGNLTKSKFKFEDVFTVVNMGLGKKKVKRSWAYE